MLDSTAKNSKSFCLIHNLPFFLYSNVFFFQFHPIDLLWILFLPIGSKSSVCTAWTFSSLMIKFMCYRATLSENFIVMINMFWQLNLTMFGGVTGHWPLSPNIFWNIPSLESTCPTSMIRNIECRVTILPIISSVNFLDFR